ncbi:MAG: protein kinase [Gemmatimonadetes bacterium]|nr:protein kinase [Gemmatimonadota bacterium]
MPLEPDQMLSHYRLVEKIGEGGMGVVWKAEDTKLGREVALKFLTEEFSADPERLARFQREAKLLASLNHANIATIHGLEEAGGERFLVLEFVPGDNLAVRLTHGPLPVADTVTICRQITEALDAAHESGVFHRDLKPANINLTPEGSVKVLDFGLAKAWEPESASADASQSPTLTYQNTRAGVILGTAAYMSPEQARGRTTDKRTDIWSFGCILFELLAGRKAFSGETISDHIAAILKGEPEWSVLPATTPPRLRALLERCLEKDRKRRLRDIGEARIELEKVEAGDTGEAEELAESPARRLFVLAAVLLVGVVAGAFLGGWLAPGSAVDDSPRPARRLSITVPEGQVVENMGFSPDGEVLVYRASTRNGEDVRLYTRRLDEFEAHELPESENARWASFSPDGRRIAYLTTSPAGVNVIKKVSLDGGPVVELLELEEAPGNAVANWWSDDELFVSLSNGRTLARLSADGGEPQEVVRLEAERLWGGFTVLPDQGTLLMGVLDVQDGEISFRTEALNLESKERRVILEDGLGGPLPGGRFIIWRDYTWFTAPFDRERLVFTGPETPLFSNRNAAISQTGTLAYIPRFTSSDSIVTVDREGRIDHLAEVENGRGVSLRWSPDGRNIAVISRDNDRVRRRLWRLDVDRKNLVPLPSGDAWKGGVGWTHDGKELTMALLGSDGEWDIGLRGSRPADSWAPMFSEDSSPGWPEGVSTLGANWSADGSVMIFGRQEHEAKWELWLLRSGQGEEPRPFLEAATDATTWAVSPDGRWVAFSSDESGIREVYVAPLGSDRPNQEMVRISDLGGQDPVWARDGTELFFEDLEGHLMTVPVESARPAADAFAAPTVLLDLEELGLVTDTRRSYDISPDGSRFVFTRRDEDPGAGSRIYIVLDWLAELDRKIPLD